jgi:hypothetical protein
VSHPTEPGIFESVLSLAATRGIAGKLQHLATLLDPESIALMPTKPTGVGLLYFVGLCPMHIPRLVTWGGVREILVIVDRPIPNR